MIEVVIKRIFWSVDRLIAAREREQFEGQIKQTDLIKRIFPFFCFFCKQRCALVVSGWILPTGLELRSYNLKYRIEVPQAVPKGH